MTLPQPSLFLLAEDDAAPAEEETEEVAAEATVEVEVESAE